MSTIKLFVEYKVPANVNDEEGMSPLMNVCNLQFIPSSDLIKFLLEQNNDPNLKSNRGANAFQIYANKKRINEKQIFFLFLINGANPFLKGKFSIPWQPSQTFSVFDNSRLISPEAFQVVVDFLKGDIWTPKKHFLFGSHIGSIVFFFIASLKVNCYIVPKPLVNYILQIFFSDLYLKKFEANKKVIEELN